MHLEQIPIVEGPTANVKRYRDATIKFGIDMKIGNIIILSEKRKSMEISSFWKICNGCDESNPLKIFS